MNVLAETLKLESRNYQKVTLNSSVLRRRVKDISGAPIPVPSQPEHQAIPQTTLVLLAHYLRQSVPSSVFRSLHNTELESFSVSPDK